MASTENKDTSGGILGGPTRVKDKVLETGASLIQDVKPVKQICAHLNAFHTYADEPGRCVETNHYCSHVNANFRQCILYDSDKADAKLIGIEYMVTPEVYEKLPEEERRLWHSHVFEVKSGMLIMPGPTMTGIQQAWETAETEEMKEVIHLYGKVYHLWQTDRGDEVPLGTPKLMTSITAEGQFDFEKYVGERDKKFGVDYKRKQELRKDIPEPDIHSDADWAWKTRVNI